MIPKPLADRITIEPIFRLQAEKEALEKRAKKSGLLIPDIKGDGKTKFDGIPNQGVVKCLPDGYEGVLKLEDHIIFHDPKPFGFKWEDKKYFVIDIDMVDAVL